MFQFIAFANIQPPTFLDLFSTLDWIATDGDSARLNGSLSTGTSTGDSTLNRIIWSTTTIYIESITTRTIINNPIASKPCPTEM